METSDKKPAIMVREPDATMQPTLQDNLPGLSHRASPDKFIVSAAEIESKERESFPAGIGSV
jgi:hypothetical protein